MTPVPVPVERAYRLINHGPTVLVSSANGASRNVMAAAWQMPLGFDPPRAAVVIHRSAHTHRLIAASGRFVLNVPVRALAAQVLAIGDRSGRDGDKFDALGLEVLPGEPEWPPRVAGCLAWLACQVVPEPHLQESYGMFIADIRAAWADPAVYDGQWHFDDPAMRSIHHVDEADFFATGEAFTVNRGC